jgi:hypothetical protein
MDILGLAASAFLFEMLISSKVPWMGGGTRRMKDMSNKWKF